MFDLRYLSGPAAILVGGVLIAVAVRLWVLNPVNRMWRIGHFVTEQGYRALLQMRPMFFLSGVWLIAGGVAKAAFWFYRQDAHHPLIQLLGTFETGLAIAVALIFAVAARRVWLQK